jgi:diguanylate cyclase (GGDEF)-like protein/PAS domain S-box-containing protein
METPEETVAATPIVDTGAFGRAFVERAPQPIAITSGSAHRIRWANPAFCELLERERAQLLDRPCRDIWPGRNAWVVLALLNRAFRTGETQVGVVLSATGAGSSTEAAPLVVWPIVNKAGVVTGLVLEVSQRTAQLVAHQRAEQTAADARAINERLLVASLRERERAEQNQHLVAELERRASHDVLTGLPNRALLYERLHHTLAAAHRDQRPFALLYVDLDRFKEVNDSFGHQAGDRLLRQIAVRLRQTLRDSDTLARIGGDEFAVLLPSFERADDVQVTAGRLLVMLARPFAVQGEQRQIAGSIGVAIYPQHGLDAATLIKRADEAMYRAKYLGGNRMLAAVTDNERNASPGAPQHAARPPVRGRTTAALTELREVNEQLLLSGLRELERTEEAQHQGEAPFRALVRHAPDIIVVADAAGFIRFVSPALIRSLGHQPEAVTGRRGLALVHPADRTRVWHLLAALPQPLENTAPFAVRVRHADRSWRQFEVVGTNLLHEPTIAGLVLTFRDVTARQRVSAEGVTAQRQRAARREDERLRLAREIHDGAVQDLLAICAQLADSQRRADSPGERPALALDHIRQKVLEVVKHLQGLTEELRPPEGAHDDHDVGRTD